MKKSTRWAWIVALVVGTGFALVLAFVVSLTTEGRSFYERNFVWLFWLNVAVAALLVLVILLAAGRLVVRLRHGKFGSRLLFKLAGIFALVGVLPGLLIYTTSYQFVSRSIEVWFDVRVEGALDAGIALGRGTLDALVNDLGSKTRLAAERLGETRSTPSALALERLREQLGAQDVTLLNASGQILAVAGASASRIAPERPSPSLLRQVRVTRVESRLEGLDDEPPPGTTTPAARVRAVALVPNPDITL
ncbi:MAG TPA: PAS domain-containing sensor histidine kinase, partial [Planctomycetota bacterium]|nr:PAS domain-containing sensor histidine kinase [Planctomycetota bacterium]